MSLPFDFDEIARGTDDVIANYTDDWWRSVEGTTRERMRTVLRRAASEGLTMPQITRELEPLFGAARAQRIAVAETTNLLGMGAQETYRRAGFGGWIWRTARDSLVDPIREDLGVQSDPKRGGRPFPMSRRFQRAHIGCRCWPALLARPRRSSRDSRRRRRWGCSRPLSSSDDALGVADAGCGGRIAPSRDERAAERHGRRARHAREAHD